MINGTAGKAFGEANNMQVQLLSILINTGNSVLILFCHYDAAKHCIEYENL